MKTVSISCEHVIREISNYIDAEVSPDLRKRMESHLADCAHCTAILDGARNVIALVADGRVLELPAGFAERLFKGL